MKVLVAGGGFAGVEALLALHELAGERVQLELISTSDTLLYRPHAVRAPFGLGDVDHIPLRPLCEEAGAQLRVGRVTAVSVARHAADTDVAGELRYDVLLVATGARRQPVVTDALTFDGTRGVVDLRRLLERAAAGELDSIAFVVPDGVTWALPLYELALLAAARLRSAGAPTRLHVVTPEPQPLGLFGDAAATRVRDALAAHGIALHPPDALHRLRAGAVVALPRLVGPAIPGLAATPQGFIPVDGHGLVDGTTTVYAVGDAADHAIKQGGLATQQAEVAATHIAARAGAAVHPRPYAPVLRALLLTGALPLYLRGGADAAATAAPLWPAQGKVIGARLSRRLGLADEPAEAQDGKDLAFALADEAAGRGDPGEALEWLAAAEAIGGALPEAYDEKRRAWTLGEAVTPRRRR